VLMVPGVVLLNETRPTPASVFALLAAVIP
jgi:hypothetical protein